jgi:CIC family chloride channel protein
MATGVIASLGAVVFRGLIAFFHNALFLGRLSFLYDANSHTTTSPWGSFVIFVPVIGAIMVIYLVRNFAPEAKGHGVPEVIDAIYYKRGKIRPVVAIIKSLASAISIGSGGSVGREGPIVQIGSAFGSGIGQLLHLPPWQTITLIASGAGAGIAATFNTPIGGLLFAAEIILHEVSVRTLVPVILATATATYLGQIFFGVHPAFVIPDLETPYFHLANPFILVSYVGLGLIVGLASAIYIKSVYKFEDSFEAFFPRNEYLRHMFGMFLVGIICLILQKTAGNYYIEGVGYSTIQDVLTGAIQSSAFMVLLFFLKLLATSLTLGSGGSGGIFSPALFMGATLGGAYGLFLHYLMPSFVISAPAFAIAGMAGVVGGVTGAALTAIVMIFEMTLDYNVVIPLTITVAVSYGMRRVICRESIYTLKLVRRGHFIPEELRSSMHNLKIARDLMDRKFIVVPHKTALSEISETMTKQPDVHWYLLEDSGKLYGIVSREQALEALCGMNNCMPLMSAVCTKWVVVKPDLSLHSVVSRMSHTDAEIALVCSGDFESIDSVVGVIGSDEIAGVLKEASDLFPD